MIANNGALDEEVGLLKSRQNTTSIRKRLVSATILLTFYMTNVMQVTLPDAILPVELVEVRGLKAIVNSVALSAFPLTNCIASFFSTELTDKLSMSYRRSLVLSGVVSFLPTLVFAIPITNDVLFVCLVSLVRLVQGFVKGMIEPQTLGVVYATFPEKIGLMVAIGELIAGISLGAGAAIGTALYSEGNIGIPFIVSNAFAVVMSVLNYFYPHPSLQKSMSDESLSSSASEDNSNSSSKVISNPVQKQSRIENENEDNEHGNATARRESLDEKRSPSSSQESNNTTLSATVKILQSPVFCLGIVLTTASGITDAYYSYFMSLYFVQVYDRPVSKGGLTLLGGSIVYGVAVIVIGILSDKGLSRMVTVVVGSVVMGISTVLFAPSILGFHWNGILVPAILHVLPFVIAFAAISVSVIPLLILHDTEPDYIKSSQKASGIFMSMYLAGFTLCPLIIGALLDVASFSVSSLVLGGMNFVALGYVLVIHFKSGNLLTIQNKM